MSFYRLGHAVSAHPYLPERAHALLEGSQSFYDGSRHFHTKAIIGGEVADGFASFILDLTHLLLMLGGVVLLAQAIFSI